MRFFTIAALLSFTTLAGVGCTSLNTVSMRWIKADDPAAHCKRQLGAHASGLPYLACAWIENGICTVVAKDFTSQTAWREMAQLGHETKHCFDKHWHP